MRKDIKIIRMVIGTKRNINVIVVQHILSLGGGIALAANRFIFNASTSDLMTQAAIVGAANFLDYMTSQPLSYFA